MRKPTFFLLVVAIAASSLLLSSCQTQPQEELTDAEKAAYVEKGKAIAKQSFEAMSGQLMAAMKRGGVPMALEYCNVAAIPLADSLSKAHSVAIRRTTLQPRNPDDAPTEVEKGILTAYAENHALGKSLDPQATLLEDGDVLFNAPILVAAQCIKCHGEPGKDIAEADLALINSLYPEDQATGYQPGDFRGMWSIRFEHKP